jgi:hypothetical protein
MARAPLLLLPKTHDCEYCGVTFTCSPNSVFCDCNQLILSDLQDADEKTGFCHLRLAFYCSQLCEDEEFPQTTSEDDVPSLEGDDTEEEPMPPLEDDSDY